MNVEIGTEAAQFKEKEYINGIFVAVYDQMSIEVGGEGTLWAIDRKKKSLPSSYQYLAGYVPMNIKGGGKGAL
jgi:hypothetical protein